jgi:hypothetical protein
VGAGYAERVRLCLPQEAEALLKQRYALITRRVARASKFARWSSFRATIRLHSRRLGLLPLGRSLARRQSSTLRPVSLIIFSLGEGR